MLEGNRCEICFVLVDKVRAQHKQTKYCANCAKRKKKENSLDPLHPIDRREYMRDYMRKYRRAHPHLSTPYVQAHRKKKRIRQYSENAPIQTGYTGLKSPSQVLYSASAILFLLLYISRHSAAITFEAIQAFIGRCSVTVVEVTGLVVIGLFSWRHVRDLWREMK